MSLLDCFCTSRTQVESLRSEKQSGSSIPQYSVDEPPLCRFPPSARASEGIRSTNVSHYELQVEIGNIQQKLDMNISLVDSIRVV